MKKILFLLVAIFATLMMNAQRIQVSLFNGQNLYGDFVQVSDTVLTILNDHGYQIKIPVSKATAVNLSGKNKITIEDGKFVLITKTQFANVQQHRESSRGIQDPDYAVGKALRTTGKTSLIIGIPSLIAGTALIAYGNTGRPSSLSKLSTKANCATAGCVLMPFGAALTVVGIPLCVKGKQLMELKVNYTGNGAGLALAW